MRVLPYQCESLYPSPSTWKDCALDVLRMADNELLEVMPWLAWNTLQALSLRLNVGRARPHPEAKLSN